MLQKRKVVEIIVCATLLCNMHTCVSGASFLGVLSLLPPTLNEYMGFDIAGHGQPAPEFDAEAVFGVGLALPDDAEEELLALE